jgi:hypothetical protein
MAYAGIGADIGIYFIDRLHRTEADWSHSVKVAGFTIQQAKEASQYCGGEPEIYVLQRPPNPRWRYLGVGDTSCEFTNRFNSSEISDHLEKLILPLGFAPEIDSGYRDELHPEPVVPSATNLIPVIALEFFPSAWLGSASYQKQIDEICIRNQSKLLRLSLKSNPVISLLSAVQPKAKK